MRRLLLFALPLALAACGTDADPNQAGPDSATGPDGASAPGVGETDVSNTGVTYATARLDPLGESSATGTVTFTETDEGLLVEYDFTGLELGEHGFHVHENGACGRGDDGTLGGAAGGHFNPYDAPHGSREGSRDERHVGDLGNITSAVGGVTGGVARGSFTDPLISLSGPNSIVDRAMMIHFKADDLSSQPSGDAGDRVSCGVVQIATAPN
ncbi:superoxide dismutase family protein [Rubricoccus marinus]|uniref:Superoxide dismutase [Cu-Zn] n=1 Tax=Rubricoccus marinus TaxID=716817 RepID=A0A259TYS6_9BACT|nr:superoxide dismutase family protein [Rubricoccus marinus]OZC02925.1 hypothetical protein BSZ36_08035 [Rubricoccus marinus]